MIKVTIKNDRITYTAMDAQGEEDLTALLLKVAEVMRKKHESK